MERGFYEAFKNYQSTAGAAAPVYAGTACTGVPIIASTNLDGKLTSLPSPVMDGYTFEGWYTDELEGDRITTSTEFTSDGTIYAHWRPIAKGGSSAASKPSPNTPTADEGFSFRAHAGTFLVAGTMFFTLVALYAR